MADIKVLMVADGGEFSFAVQPGVPGANYFGLTRLIGAMTNSAAPSIQVETAHRRGYTFGPGGSPGAAYNASLGVSPQYANADFTFAPTGAPDTVSPANLGDYDVLWLMGYEGFDYNPQADPYPNQSEITDAEKIAIAQFMEGGGGVFAVGDHDGLGSLMCGKLIRVRTMRKWFVWGDAFTDPASGQTFAVNWNVDGLVATAPDQTDRNDSLRPDAADGQYYFDDQSDPTPQPTLTASGDPLASSPGPIHPLLRDAVGTVIAAWPDHMHEGEATDFATVMPPGSPPFTPNDAATKQPYQVSYTAAVGDPPTAFTEFPVVDGFQPEPEIIVFGSDIGDHITIDGLGGPDVAPGNTNPITDFKITGRVSVYDGRGVGKGRIVTGSSLHHYADLNLQGSPGTESPDPQYGPTNSALGLPADVVAGMEAYYVNVVTWLARANTSFAFWTVKSTFGADETATGAAQGAAFTNAFYLVLDGYTPAQVGASPVVSLTGPFASVGVAFQQGATIFTQGGGSNTAQRILIPFTIASIPSGAFPVAGAAPSVLALEGRVTVNGTAQVCEALFELAAGEDPYFTNIDPTSQNAFYLSQDLRVFQAAPAVGPPPFIAFPSGGDGYDYMTALLTYLNDPVNGFTAGTTDPFQTLMEAGDMTEASSASPTVTTSSGTTVPAYSFAVARVRLKGAPGARAKGVKVFFRLWNTTTNDTDYDAQTTYLSTYDGDDLPDQPLPGIGQTTYPLYATSGGMDDYDVAQPVNQRDITVGAGVETWAYFGCYLDVYGNPQIPALVGAHHCLVAQIAYDLAPIEGAAGLAPSPENCDKLAQRNILFSGVAPGDQIVRRISQPVGLRPSARFDIPAGQAGGRPDELMIDWGDTPREATARLYWPGAAAVEVARLGNLLYAAGGPRAVDAHTVELTAVTPIGFAPIPYGAAGTLPGLLTIDLPPDVKRETPFTVVARRLRDHRGDKARADSPLAGWRQVVGTFQISIPVGAPAALLPVEENALAILEWRLKQAPETDPWRPVLERYVVDTAMRVDGFGGDYRAIRPSPLGAHPKIARARPVRAYTGRVREVIFAGRGACESFLLETPGGVHRFVSRGAAAGDLVTRACGERLKLTVVVDRDNEDRIIRLILRA